MRNCQSLLLLCVATLSLSAQSAITKTELAGQNLSQYPYFQYVRSFHFTGPPRVAIDPTRFPGIVGQTCDIYIVNHKTPAGWAIDPTLIDLTPGGALTHTFVAGTIQMNSVAVVPTLVLTDDAGSNLGVPYDVVLDCNRDGLLNGDDYIDGLGREAGFYMVHDIAHHGPFTVSASAYNLASSVAASFGIPAAFRAELVYYPSSIAKLHSLPLVVISHGNGFTYKSYDYLARHLASWGYVVMVHANDTVPGPSAAAKMTLLHTDAFLYQALAGAIAQGDLAGHINAKRIAWVGHGRGGEGVVIAYHELYTSGYVPQRYDRKYIRFLDSMAPTDFEWTGGSGTAGITQPHDANYHLWAPAGEWDVSGDPADPIAQSQPIADRAIRYKAVTTVHGMRLSQFAETVNAPSIAGPAPMLTDSAHLVVNGYLVALLKHFVDGNLPALDYLTRPQQVFHPLGLDPYPIVDVQNEYRSGNDAASGILVIDDYQSNTATTQSSSGGAVNYNVSVLSEGRLDDNDNTFAWTPADPFNGAIFATAVDESRGVTFEWKGKDLFYEWKMKSWSGTDFSPYSHLSFRGAQATRHPFTTATLGNLTFQLELRDAGGHTSAINIGAYGGGLEDPYQRAGGWFDEMQTIRFRLTDFLNNGSALDLSHIVAVRLKVGPSFGDARGRIVIDDLMLVNDAVP